MVENKSAVWHNYYAASSETSDRCFGGLNAYIDGKGRFMRKIEVECCEVTCIHEEKVQKVLEVMPDEERIKELADFYKVFGDATRVKILYVLLESEMCVCDLAALLKMTQSAISHQLRILKGAKLVKNRRDGKLMYYSLDDEHVKQIFDAGYKHIMHTV